MEPKRILLSIAFSLMLFCSCQKNDGSSSPSNASTPSLGEFKVTIVGQDRVEYEGRLVAEGSGAVTSRGICWNTSPNPTLSNNSAMVATTGTGAFGGKATGLAPNTTYYARAFAKNASGVAYSSEVSFKTVELTVTDIDGNVYDVIEIKDRGAFWTKQNLRTTKYRSGEAIATGLDNDAWFRTTAGAYAIYVNNNANDVTYGKLYNWFAVNDTKWLCPAGYHVPTLEDYNLLTFSYDGGALKSTSPLWKSPNTGATNSSGFTALPAGVREREGRYYGIGESAHFWLSTREAYNAFFFYLSNGSAGSRADYLIPSYPPQYGYSCRCVKDK